MGVASLPMPPSPDSALQAEPAPLTTPLPRSWPVTPRMALTRVPCCLSPSVWLTPTATATGSPLSLTGGLGGPRGSRPPRRNANSPTAASMDTLRPTTSAPAVTGKSCGGGSRSQAGSSWYTGSDLHTVAARGALRKVTYCGLSSIQPCVPRRIRGVQSRPETWCMLDGGLPAAG